MDKNSPLHAQLSAKIRARQSPFMRLQWEVHSDAIVEHFLFLVGQGKKRMSKTKMRCNTCGKWFQSANAKEITCPDCVQKARKEKLAAKNAPPATNKGATASNQPKVVAPPPKPKTEHRGTNQWLDSLEDVKIA